ncbi:MAG TPA: tetratricopeptide repeat protein [Candidatus Aminicenantes bacterium]|nr:tetratricopeptide repeat protein [Candidatus Aminicenantes bacterium]
MKHKNILVLLLLFALIISLSPILSAQEGQGRGRISGKVTDQAGNPIEGVNIVAEHLKFNVSFEAKSNKRGKWAIAGMGAGLFRITASKQEYNSAYVDIQVSQFKNKPVAITLTKIKRILTGMPTIEYGKSIAIIEEGNQLYSQEKYAEAVVKYEEFLEKNPSIRQILNNIGNCYQEMGEYEKAIAAFNKFLDWIKEEKGSLEGNENAARTLASIGGAYMKQGDLEKGSEYFKQSLDVLPADEALAFNLGAICFKQGEREKAIEYFKLAIQIKDTWALPYLKLGYTYLNKGEYQLAIDSFKKFLELASDDPQAATIQNLIPQLEKLIKK